MMADGLTRIEYVGPPGQERSDKDGHMYPLTVGDLFPFPDDFATYLCTRHPDYWRAPGKAAKPATKE